MESLNREIAAVKRPDSDRGGRGRRRSGVIGPAVAPSEHDDGSKHSLAESRETLLVSQDFAGASDPELIKRFRRSAPWASVFQFDERKSWALVVPHLGDPRFLAALDQGMREWVEEEWDPEAGPWSYGRLDWLIQNATEALAESGWEFPSLASQGVSRDAFDPMDEDLEALDEALGRFMPQPGTIAWYRAYGGCHYLAPAFAALGRLLYPELMWHVIRGECHTVAWGSCQEDPAGILMDPIMTGPRGQATAAEIVDLVLRTGEE